MKKSIGSLRANRERDMKIIVNLSRLMACSLLALSTHVMATQYTQNITGCSVTKLGTNKFQAKFTYVVTPVAGGSVTTRSNFYVEVPTTVGTNLIVHPQNSSTSTFSNVVANANLGYNISTRGLSFYGIPNANVIMFSSFISIDFTTDTAGAYPGLRARLTNENTGGASQTSVMYIAANGCQLSITNIPKPEDVDTPEPAFTMSSAVWQMNTLDVSNLPDISASGNGYAASISNIASNNLCINYVTAGVKNKAYALSVTNTSSMQGGRSLFTLQGTASQLFYNLQLASNDGVTANDFSFPTASAKYITLTQTASSTPNRSQMCWTPKINLFKNAATKEGMHTGSVNFVISPKA
ncbi:hypothetical protein ACMV5I_25765 [Serratia sp. T13T92]|uniref:hypothetical protein n=1 Tax=Serratia sp. T13T92 TaxID=3397496 RepID=UPI0039DF4246